MATKELIPSLSEAGWVDDSTIGLDKLMSYFFASDFSQSYIYFNKIKSMSYLISQFGNGGRKLAVEVEKALLDLLSGYYTEVDVTVKVESGTPNNTTLGSGDSNINDNLSIFLEVHDTKGRVLNLSKVLKIKDGSFKTITDVNNNGE